MTSSTTPHARHLIHSDRVNGPVCFQRMPASRLPGDPA